MNNMNNMNNKFNKKITSFIYASNATPCALSNIYLHTPYISLKVDGIFMSIEKSEYNNFYPVFPPEWTKIEGEYYEFPNGYSILYLLYIEVNGVRKMRLEDMYNEIETYFLDQLSGILHPYYDVDDDIIINRMYNNIDQSIMWLNQNIDNKMIWWPKKYFKLDTHSWNDYIDQLDYLFNSINSQKMLKLIKQDGLILTPTKLLKNNLVKIKKRNDLSINLYFTGNNFCSKQKKSYTDLIEINNIQLEKNTVYKCILNENGKYIPTYKKINKKADNSYDIDITVYLYNNYFYLGQLKDQYVSPWFSKLITKGIDEIIPLLQYVDNINDSIIPYLNYGIVLDIGCGSMGRYTKHFVNSENLIKYIGFDIDLIKLNEAYVKVNYDKRFNYVLMDITNKWSKQNNCILHDLWDTYYKNMINLDDKVDNIISIYSSQYANISSSKWLDYINDINNVSKSGTNLFIMWIDYTKIIAEKNNKYVKYDNINNILTVNLPHRNQHVEFGLSEKEIIDSFDDKWIINKTLMCKINKSNDTKEDITDYINLNNFIILTKK